MQALINIAYDEIIKCNPKNKSLHVCIIRHHKRIISIGHNDEKRTHPSAHNYIGHKIHAEMSAFLKVRHYDINYNKCKLYSIRIGRNGSVTNALPCKNCQKLIYQSGIKRVYYTTIDGTFKKLPIAA